VLGLAVVVIAALLAGATGEPDDMDPEAAVRSR
jgi:hypothetical protein